MKKFVFLCVLILFSFIIISNNKLVQAYSAEVEVELPILMYHDTSKGGNAKYNVNPKRLEEDFKYIKNNNYNTIDTKDLLDFFEKGKSLKSKPIMITVDDGSYNNYLNMLPLLEKYDMKAVFFVVGKFVEDNYDKNGNLNKYHAYSMDYECLKKLKDNKHIDIQYHSYNMHNMKERNGMKNKKGESYEVYKSKLKKDYNKFKELMEKKAEINDFIAVAYPFGSFSKSTQKAVKEIGLKMGFTCSEEINKLNKNINRYNLFRFNRDGRLNTKNFFNNMLKKKAKYC